MLDNSPPSEAEISLGELYARLDAKLSERTKARARTRLLQSALSATLALTGFVWLGDAFGWRVPVALFLIYWAKSLEERT